MREAKSSWFCYAVVVVCLLGALTGCSRDPNVRKQKYLESGERYYDKGQYGEAAIQFQNAIQVDSHFARAHYKLGLAAMKLGQAEVAYTELSTTLQIEPQNYPAHLDMARLLVSAGPSHSAEAKEHLDLLAQKEPNNPDVYLVLATYYNTATKDTGAALNAIHKALQLDPNRYEFYLSLGILDVQGQEWADAETNFKKAVELAPKSAEPLITLGNFYQSRGRFPEAEQTFRRAVQSVPNDPGPRLSLAGLFLAENKLGQAEDYLRQSVKDFPGNTIGYSMLGNFYIQTNQMDKALAEYASLYQQHGKEPMVKRNYIQLLILKDRLDEARKLNDEILKAQPNDSDAQIFKAQIQLHGGKGNDAANTLQGVLKNDPENAVAHYQLGLALDQMGNSSRAESEWRDAVRLRPDIVEAHRALAGSAIHRNDASMLAQEADQIMSLQPAAPDGYLLRGVAEIDRRQFLAAEQYLKQSLEKEPHNPSAYVQLGNLRMLQNQTAEAQKAYQQALDQDPNSADALGGLLNGYLVQKQPDKALAAIKAQIAKYPNNTAFHTMLGDLLKQAKDSGGAEAEYKRAAELNKNNVVALVKLGMAQGERGALDTSLQTYLDAAQNNPKEPTFYLLAGSIYEKKDDWDRAKQMYQKVLGLEPDNPLASNNMAYVMLQQGGNVDVAFAMAQSARRQLPDNASSADTLGWAFYHKRVYTSAIGLFQEAVKKEPDNALFIYHLGLAYAKNGQLPLARQQLDKVSRIKPNSSEADDLRRALAEAAKGQG